MQPIKDVPIVPLETIDDYKRLLWLVANEHVMVYPAVNQDEDLDSHFKDRHLRYAIQCSDLFYYACTDYTEFDLTDTQELKEMFEKFGHNGLIAWCARDRRETPLKEWTRSPEYQAAYEYCAKFMEGVYEHVLLADAKEYERLKVELGGIDYSAELINVEKGHWAVRTKIDMDQMYKLYKYVHCIYRNYGNYRVKEVKFKYFNGYSVYGTREIVANVLGFSHDMNKGYIPKEDV